MWYFGLLILNTLNINKQLWWFFGVVIDNQDIVFIVTKLISCGCQQGHFLFLQSQELNKCVHLDDQTLALVGLTPTI